jgi:hypothetical protein
MLPRIREAAQDDLSRDRCVGSVRLEAVPRKKASGSLTGAQLGAIAEASLANAAELMREARLLIEDGAAARSYSLAVLAAEEFG